MLFNYVKVLVNMLGNAILIITRMVNEVIF